MFSRSSSIVGARELQQKAFSMTVLTQRRHLEHWGHGVTYRTQPYAQGDKLPQVDNVRLAINKSTGAAAAATGNHLGIAYDSSNIFSVKGYSQLEKEHYTAFRGLTKYKIDPILSADGPSTVKVIKELMEPEVEASLKDLWWNRLLKDFPSLKKPATPAFREAWENFYLSALAVADNEEQVAKLAAPFMREQNQKNFISHSMVWRIAERLSDAIEAASFPTKQERRSARVSIERVTKIALNTIVDEPWANEDATNPLLFDVSSFRAWHEAGNW